MVRRQNAPQVQFAEPSMLRESKINMIMRFNMEYAFNHKSLIYTMHPTAKKYL